MTAKANCKHINNHAHNLCKVKAALRHLDTHAHVIQFRHLLYGSYRKCLHQVPASMPTRHLKSSPTGRPTTKELSPGLLVSTVVVQYSVVLCPQPCPYMFDEKKLPEPLHQLSVLV